MPHVKLIVLTGNWDRNVLLPLDGAQRCLPRGSVNFSESQAQAASRLAASFGVKVQPEEWTWIPSLPADPADETLLAIRAPATALQQARQGDATRWTQAELALCSSWVNPGKYEAGLLGALERARDCLNAVKSEAA